MGHPKFSRKKYDTPLHPWKEVRIKSERELIKKYGLKNHKEVWKAKTYLGKYRHQARTILAKIGAKDPQVKKESDQLLLHLTRMGILPTGSSLEDVLALETEAVLSRRLQTLVYLKGFSSTPNHSRQLINHGHIAIGERKVTIPGYMVPKDEEIEISYTSNSALNELSHPARPKSDMTKTIPEIPKQKEKEPKKSEDDKKEEKSIKEPVKEPDDTSKIEKDDKKGEEKVIKEPIQKTDDANKIEADNKQEENAAKEPIQVKDDSSKKEEDVKQEKKEEKQEQKQEVKEEKIENPPLTESKNEPKTKQDEKASKKKEEGD